MSDHLQRVCRDLLSFTDISILSPLLQTKTVDAFAQQSLDEHSIVQVREDSNTRTQILWFFAEWCGHCVKMKSAWEKAHQSASHLADWHVIDAANSGKQLTSAMGVRSFPSVKRIRTKIVEDFDGHRTAEGLIAFATA